MKKLVSCLFLILPAQLFAQYSKAEVAFVIPEKDLIPEGITYDAATETFFVGSISKKKIVAVGKNGVSEFVAPGTGGLRQVLGMKVHNGYLWACNNTGDEERTPQNAVHQFDLKTGKLTRSFVIDNDSRKHLLNDITFTADGNAYISDMNGSAIYKLDVNAGTIAPFFQGDEARFANGIATMPDGKTIVTCSARGFVQINTETKETSTLPFNGYYILGVDGLYRLGNSLVGIQNVTFPVCIIQYQLSADHKSITRADVLNIDDPLYDIPTTGVVVGEWFYFIANTHLHAWDEAKGKLKEDAKLKDVVIARVKLKKG